MPKFKKDVVGEFRKFDDYWKKDANGVQRPYLDGIDKFLIIDRGTLAANVRTSASLAICLRCAPPSRGFFLPRRSTCYLTSRI